MDPLKILKAHGFAKCVRIRDEATGIVRDVVRFNCYDGKRGRLELQASTFHESRELERKLRDADAILPDEKEERQKVLEALARVTPGKRKTLLARAGWLNNMRGFCIGDRVLGQVPEGAISPAKRKEKHASGTHLRVQGTAEQWRDKVSVLAKESSAALFIASVPFAAPLLRPMQQQSFGYNLYAPTRHGKSLISLLSASAQGISGNEDMLTWSLSDARLEEILPAWNDVMMPIEDLMTMREQEGKRKIARADEFAYHLSTGREFDRHSSFTGGKQPGEWLTIVVTQSELSLAEMAQRHRLERKEGAAYRLLDLPAVGADEPDIFDLYAKREGRRPTLEWRANYFERVIKRCRLYCGAAHDAYMTALLPDREAAVNAAVADQKSFIQEVLSPLDGLEARDVAMKFGLIYAGSCRAVDYGIVAWSRDDALEAAKVCYQRARALLPDEALLLQDGLKRLRSALLALPIVVGEAMTHALPEEAVGFRHRVGDVRRCVISTEFLAGLFSSQRQKELVLQWCADNNRLTVAQVKRQRDGICPKEQFMWPGRVRRRSCEFKIPVSEHI